MQRTYQKEREGERDRDRYREEGNKRVRDTQRVQSDMEGQSKRARAK